MRFRSDLYEGTAAAYDRYRPAYPLALLDDLRARVPVTGGGRLLDLACGTGQIAFPLAADFAEVMAADQEAGAVAFGRRKAERLGIDNIAWFVGGAETVVLDGKFELIGIGNAFHRLDREVVARRLTAQLQPGGCVALLWADTPWRGDAPWQQTLAQLLDHWRRKLDVADRVPQGWAQAIEGKPHAEVLEQAGLNHEGRFEFQVSHEWTVESLVGFVYSTSFLNRTVLGASSADFENDLHGQLVGSEGAAPFRQQLSFAYELARLVVR